MDLVEDMEISEGSESDSSDMDIAQSDEETPVNVIQPTSNGIRKDIGPPTSAANTNATNVARNAQETSLTESNFTAVNNNNNNQGFQLNFYQDYGRPLVEDLNVSYIIDVGSEGDKSEDIIDSLYGPFPLHNQLLHRETVNVSSSPPPHKARILANKQKQIEQLKRLIAEREKQLQQKAAKETSTTGEPNKADDKTTELGTSAKNTEEKKLQERASQENGNLKKTLHAMEQELQDMTSKSEVEALVSTTKVQETGSEETASGNVNVDTKDTSKELSSEENALSEEEEGESDNESSESGYESDESYATAPGSPSNVEPVAAIEKQMEELQKQVKEYREQLQTLEKARRDAQVKLLGLQVKISLEQNRKSLSKVHRNDAEGPKTGDKRTSMEVDDAQQLPRKRVREYENPSKEQKTPVHETPRATEFADMVTDYSYRKELIAKQERPAPPVPPSTTAQAKNFASSSSIPLRQHEQPSSKFQPSVPHTVPPTVDTRTRHSPIVSKKSFSPVSGVTPLADGMKLSTYLTEVEELVTMRLSADDKALPASERSQRTAMRPTRVMTVDGFTFTLNSVLMKGASRAHQDRLTLNPTTSTESEPINQAVESIDNIAFESPLINVVRRSDQSKSVLPADVQQSIENIVRSLPPITGQDISSRHKWGQIPLMLTKRLAEDAATAHPDVELFWGLYSEILLYFHGDSDIFRTELKRILKRMPMALDVHWQAIRAASLKGDWLPSAIEYIQDLAKKKFVSDNEVDSQLISGLTAEVLLRIMRYRGASCVVHFLTCRQDTVIREDVVEPFSLEGSFSIIYLTDHDVYIIWMSILYDFIFKKMPDSICRQWQSSLVTTGAPATSKPLFTIDWSQVVSESPLTRPEQLGAANIILSMLRFFSKKARGDDRKRPLLMGVWRTLMDFLVHIECYKRAGTLALIRAGLDVEALQPENYDIAAYLETRMGDRAGALGRLHSVTRKLPMSQKLIMAYRSAITLCPSEKSSAEDFQEAARLVGLPLREMFDMSAVSLEPGNVQVDFVRRLYLSALGMDPVLPVPAKRSFNQNLLRSCAFAWINLIFLTQISRWLYTNHILKGTLAQQLATARDMAIEALQDEEAKRLIFKYAEECLAM